MATRVLDVILFFPKLVMFQMLKWSVRKRARVRTQEILATSLRKFMATTREVDEQEVNSQVLGTRNGWHRLSEGLFTYTKTGGFILLSKDTSLAEMIHQVLDIELEDELAEFDEVVKAVLRPVAHDAAMREFFRLARELPPPLQK